MHMVTLGLVAAGVAVCDSEILCRFPENECTCELCVDACNTSPCWGTPQEMDALIRAGYGKKLMVYVLPEDEFDDRPAGIFMDRVWVVSPAYKTFKSRTSARAMSVSAGHPGVLYKCVFLKRGGLCELHDPGLKPIEGRIEHHEISGAEAIAIRREIFKLWNTPYGTEVAHRWYDEYHL